MVSEEQTSCAGCMCVGREGGTLAHRSMLIRATTVNAWLGSRGSGSMAAWAAKVEKVTMTGITQLAAISKVGVRGGGREGKQKRAQALLK
jgi:hypothetical protein